MYGKTGIINISKKHTLEKQMKSYGEFKKILDWKIMDKRHILSDI